MRVLYVVGLWPGPEDMVLGYNEDPGLLPALKYPLKALIEAGHQVDIVMTTPFDELEPEVAAPWLKDVEFHFVPWRIQGWRRAMAPFATGRLYRTISKLLKGRRYDFVYGHGTLAAVANVAARAHGIPCGVRLYGTFRAPDLQGTSNAALAFHHPFEYLCYRLPKEFLLVTDDGTAGDQVVERLGGPNPPYEFHFWLNGTDLPDAGDLDNIELPTSIPDDPWMLYAGRIIRWKRTHLAVQLLAELHDAGRTDIHLCLAGQIIEQDYWARVLDTADELGVRDHVHYLGLLPLPVLLKAYREAAAVPFAYRYSNLGNTLIEALSVGALVVAVDDGLVPMDRLFADDDGIILAASVHEAARRLAAVLDDEGHVEGLRAAATKLSRTVFQTWPDRAAREVHLIEEAVMRPIVSHHTTIRVADLPR